MLQNAVHFLEVPEPGTRFLNSSIMNRKIFDFQVKIEAKYWDIEGARPLEECLVEKFSSCKNSNSLNLLHFFLFPIDSEYLRVIFFEIKFGKGLYNIIFVNFTYSTGQKYITLKFLLSPKTF